MRVRESETSKSAAFAVDAHLENCTGKTFRAKRRKRKIPVRSGSCEANKSSHMILSIVLGRIVWRTISKERVEARSSEQERRVDAKALIADEGRDKLRKAMGSRKWALIHGYPNGGTRLE